MIKNQRFFEIFKDHGIKIEVLARHAGLSRQWLQRQAKSGFSADDRAALIAAVLKYAAEVRKVADLLK